MNILQFLINIQAKDNGVIGRVTRLQQRLDAADRSASRLTTKIGTGLRSAILSLPGAEFFTNPIVALTAGVGVVSRLGMEADKTAVSFEVLLGSQEKSADMLKQMNKYAADSPYSRLGVQEAAKTMLGFGVSQERIMPSLQTIGDIAMGDAEKFKGLALVFSQVAAAGKLQGQDLLQMVTNGYNPLLDISKLTGKSMAQLRDEMSEGKITFDMVYQAMKTATGEGGKYNGMVERIAKTPFGRFGQLVDQFKETLINLYKVIEPLLIPAFDVLSGLLTSSQPLITAMASGVQWLINNFETIAPFIYGTAAAWAVFNGYMFFSTTILKGWTVAQWLQIKAMIVAEKVQRLYNAAVKANPIMFIISLVIGLVTAIVYCWNKFAGFRAFIYTAWDTMVGFGKAIKDAVINRFWELIEGLGAVGKALISLVKGDFEEAWEQAQSGAKKLMGVETAQKFAAQSKAVAQNSSKWYADYLKREEDKQKAKDAAISDPQAMVGTDTGTSGISGGGGTTDTDSGKANEITAGGTRNTQITINITKFFDYLNVTMMDKTDTTELQRVVLECMNRSLETAMSAAR